MKLKAYIQAQLRHAKQQTQNDGRISVVCYTPVTNWDEGSRTFADDSKVKYDLDYVVDDPRDGVVERLATWIDHTEFQALNLTISWGSVYESPGDLLKQGGTVTDGL